MTRHSLYVPAAAVLWMMLNGSLRAQEFRYPVEHQHALRNCRGTLILGPESVAYQTDHKDDSRTWRYRDIRQIKVESAMAIEIVTFEDQRRLLGRDRIFRFRLLEGGVSPAASAMVEQRTARPLVTAVFPSAPDSAAFAVGVKHLHTWGGCEGVLRIFADRVTFESADRSEDSRLWRYDGIEGFNWTEAFRLEIATWEDQAGGPRKTYRFQFKEKLDPAAYDYLWLRIHPSRYYPR